MTTNKQLRELAEKATPGPWCWDGTVYGYDAENEAPWLIQERGGDVVITGGIKCSKANAEYIATVSPEVITALLDENEALQAECERLRGLLRDTASVAIAMLYDSHKADVLAEFKVPELEAVVDASKHLQSHRVEHVYRRAWDAAIDAAMEKENKA